jgi:magnesium transporter
MGVLHAIADTVVDQYLDVVTALEADADEVANDAFSLDAGHDVRRIYQLKRELVELRRTVVPLRDLAGRRVPGVDKVLAVYFQDIADLPQLSASLEPRSPPLRPQNASPSLTELVDNALTVALAQTSLQQNLDMLRISAAAALIAIQSPSPVSMA